MLSSFYVQNFRSILELKLDFTYGDVESAKMGTGIWEIPPVYPEPRLKSG